MRERKDGTTYRGWDQQDEDNLGDGDGQKKPRLRRIWHRLTGRHRPHTPKQGVSSKKPAFTPRHAFRDAMSTYRIPPPVLPRELRCANSNFAMDRLAHRSTTTASSRQPDSVATQSTSNSSGPSGTATSGSSTSPSTAEPSAYKGKGKARADSGFANTPILSPAQADHLGCPLNPNMLLAARCMPDFHAAPSPPPPATATRIDGRTGRIMTIHARQGSDAADMSPVSPKSGPKRFPPVSSGHSPASSSAGSSRTSACSAEGTAHPPSPPAAEGCAAEPLASCVGQVLSVDPGTSAAHAAAGVQPGAHLALQRRALRHKDGTYFRRSVGQAVEACKEREASGDAGMRRDDGPALVECVERGIVLVPRARSAQTGKAAVSSG